MTADRGRIVYSTGPGRPESAEAASDASRHETSLSPEHQRIRVHRERAGRRGKTVTVAGVFRLTRDDAVLLHRELKQNCGCGGALRATPDGFDLELQGDRVDTVLVELTRRDAQPYDIAYAEP